MDRGYVQVYTGDGKGKTTAALGLGLRAVGRGFRVKMYQFLKGSKSGELESVKYLKGQFEIIRLAESEKFYFAMNPEEKKQLKKKLKQEWKQLHHELESHSCDLLILDEIMAAYHTEMLSLEEILTLIDNRPVSTEMVLTGRRAPQEIIDKADLVTEMRPVKHYLQKGVKARMGIEK